VPLLTTPRSQVLLVSIVHVGEQDYYDRIQSECSASSQRCLVECITSGANTTQDARGRRLTVDLQPTPSQRKVRRPSHCEGETEDSRQTHTPLRLALLLARGDVWPGWACRVHTPSRVPHLWGATSLQL
jgi:hypothetical protein